MSQIDTTPPIDFRPQPEAFPPDWDDSSAEPPVPDLYLPKFTPVHNLPSERITTATYQLDNLTPVQIVAKSEQGIGCRVTLSISQVSANVVIGCSKEALQAIQQVGPAGVGTFIPGGFIIPAAIGAAGVAPVIQLATCEELWAIATLANALTVAWVSVLQEQFYGD